MTDTMPSRTAPAETLDPGYAAGASADHGPSVPQQRAPLDAERADPDRPDPDPARADPDRGHRGCGTRLHSEYWDLARAAWVTGS